MIGSSQNDVDPLFFNSDVEVPVDGGKHTDTSGSMVNIFVARGILIESEGNFALQDYG